MISIIYLDTHLTAYQPPPCRDLSFALFCVGGGPSRPNEDPNDEDQEPREEWSIPRSHLPMGTMICSWLICCTIGWPVPKVFEEVPCRFEEVVTQPSADSLDTEEADSPPTEITVPTRKCISDEHQPVLQEDEPEAPNEQIESSGVQVKFSLWSDLVSLSRKDWWFTLRVLRDISDLVSSGWCPPPSAVGNKICTLLVSISVEGLSPILDSQEDTLPDEDMNICRESCAAESLALLKNLASHDTLPLDSVNLITSSLCRLLSASEKVSSHSLCNCYSTLNDHLLTII